MRFIKWRGFACRFCRRGERFCKPRAIVSGVGKSGHIGNKIAATLPTGTPASFVHATEASHGDLGMVTAADFCLLISILGNIRTS